MKQNIDKSIDILNYVIYQSDKTLHHFSGQKPNFIIKFCLCMIERLNFSSVALRVLLKTILENSKVEFSCGIILRSVFLDTIILLNAIEITGKTNEGSEVMLSEFSQFCFDMLGDTVKFSLEEIKAECSKYDKNKKIIMYNNFVNDNASFFEPYANDGTVPILKKINKHSPKTLVSKIKNSKDFNQRACLYNAYLYYSKYDHFGQMFYSLTRKDIIFRLEFLNKSIQEIPRAFLYAHYLLLPYVLKDYMVNQYDEIKNFVYEMEKLNLKATV